MDPRQITEQVNFIVEELKRQAQAVRSKSEKKDRPKFNPIYGKTVELKERIEIHSDLDKKPLEMMEKRAPYEDDRQYKWRKENWNNVTMPYFAKALGKLNRIMAPSNYSINWSVDNNEQKDYFEKDIPLCKSIDNFFEQVVLVKKILDPNALLVVKPYYLPMKEVEIDGKAMMIPDETKNMPVVPVIVDCERVLEYREGEFAIIELVEKSLVEFNRKKVREGFIFEIYDRNIIWRVEQIGNKVDWQFSAPYIYYQHDLNKLPCQKLKGYPKHFDLHVYYQSYFIYAVPNLDTAIYLNSNLDMSMVNHMHPQLVEQVQKCKNEQCMGRGFISEFHNDQEIRRPCPDCLGTGGMSKTGPMMSKQLVISDSLDDTSNGIQPPGKWYVAPPSEPLEFISKKIDDLVAAAFLFVNMDVSNSEVKGTETALGKSIDREELFTFLMRISNELFDLLSFTIEVMGMMRYGKEFKAPQVHAPTSFQIRSEYDLTQELVEAKKAGMPEVALREIIRQTIAKRFSSQVEIEKATNLIMAVDRLVTLSNLESKGEVASGTATKWQHILHTSAGTYIEQLLIEKPDFFSLAFDVQRDALYNKAKEDPALIVSDNGTAASVLNIANNPAA